MHAQSIPCPVCAGFNQQLRQHFESDVHWDLRSELDDLDERAAEANAALEVSMLRALHLGQRAARHAAANMYVPDKRKSIQQLAHANDAMKMFPSFLSEGDVVAARTFIEEQFNLRELDGINSQLVRERTHTTQMEASTFERTRIRYLAVCSLLEDMRSLLRGNKSPTLNTYGKRAATTLLLFIDSDDALAVGKVLVTLNKENAQWNL